MSEGLMLAPGAGRKIVGGGLESSSGQYLHVGPGSFIFVPEKVPHAFGNQTDAPVKLFFQSSVPGGHENYFRTRGAYDIEQLTTITSGRAT